MKYTIILLSLILLAMRLTGCKQDIVNFSQYPGFTEYFKANPPGHEPPDLRDQALLERYRPRFMMAEEQQKPIDFYRDYSAHGILRDGEGNVVSRHVTKELLNRYKYDPYAEFQHVPANTISPPIVFGRILRETVPFDTDKGLMDHQFTILSYHSVFRTSGLPLGIPAWQESILSLYADLNDWHQLDHYTAVFLVLEGDGHERRNLLAVMLQQHNNLRTYLIGESITLPPDDRVIIDVAIRSNELYPHIPGRTHHRAVAMPDPESMYFLLTGKKKPLFAGFDITESTLEVEYTLDFLPPDDAFYTFRGFLGEKRRTTGRSGPQGADYNTLPELKPMSIQLFSGYWRKNHPGDLKRLESTIISQGDHVGFARLQRSVFYQSWKQLQGVKNTTVPAQQSTEEQK
jgi:hypothetical protein